MSAVKPSATAIQAAIIGAIDRAAPVPQSVPEIARETLLSSDRVRRQLAFLVDTGVVLKHDIYYRLANQS